MKALLTAVLASVFVQAHAGTGVVSISLSANLAMAASGSTLSITGSHLATQHHLIGFPIMMAGIALTVLDAEGATQVIDLDRALAVKQAGGLVAVADAARIALDLAALARTSNFDLAEVADISPASVSAVAAANGISSVGAEFILSVLFAE